MVLGFHSSNWLWDRFEGVRRPAPVHSLGAGRIVVLRLTPRSETASENREDVGARDEVGRVAGGAAIALTVVLPLLDLAHVASVPEWAGRFVPALIAVACSAPLQLRLLVAALRNERAPHAGTLLALLALVHVGAAILVGPGWLPGLALLAVSAQIAIPGSVGLLAAAGTVLLAAGLARFSGFAAGANTPLYVGFAVAWRSTSLIVVVQLVAAVRRLDAARRELRDRAVVRERIRIDGELRSDLGRALDDIAQRAGRASEVLETDRPMAAREVRSLVDESRTALGRARRLVTRYQEASVGAELQASRTLLEAAGVEARIVIADDRALEATDERSLSVVRAAVINVLLRDSIERCVLEIGHEDDGRVRVDVLTEPSAAASPWAGSR